MGRNGIKYCSDESAGASVSVVVKYGEVAVGAREYLAPSASEKAYFVELEDLQESSANTLDWGNPCDPYSVVLDGEADAIPLKTGKSKGFFSEQISDEFGNFASPIVLSFFSEEYDFSSKGITLEFDSETKIRAKSVNVKWYRQKELISEKSFDIDSSFFFCENSVNNYNEIELTFFGVNMPFAHLHLKGIEWGYYRDFTANELRSVSIKQEIDPLSAELSSNYCDIKFDFQKNIDFQFKKRQPIIAYKDGKLIQKAFIQSAKQISKNAWSVECGDYIEILAESTFVGDLYFKKEAVELIGEIFNAAKVPYKIDPVFNGVTVSGRIPYTDCREALKEVVFAIGAIVDTSGEEVVSIKTATESVSQKIPRERIIGSQKFEEKPIISSVEVFSTEYFESEKEFNYENKSGERQENLLLVFDNPVDVYDIIGEDSEVIESNFNYALVNIGENAVVVGTEYEPKKTVKMKKTSESILPNKSGRMVSVKNAGLVNLSNVDNVLLRCYNYYINEEPASFSIFEGKHEKENPYGLAVFGQEVYNDIKEPTIEYDSQTKVGDLIEYETEYKGIKRARIVSQKFSLVGGAIVKQTEVV